MQGKKSQEARPMKMEVKQSASKKPALRPPRARLEDYRDMGFIFLAPEMTRRKRREEETITVPQDSRRAIARYVIEKARRGQLPELNDGRVRVCQHCGKVKSYFGFAESMAATAGGMFICYDCRILYRDDKTKGLDHKWKAIESVKNRGFWFCELCLDHVEKENRLLCKSCSAMIDKNLEMEEFRRIWNQIKRSRVDADYLGRWLVFRCWVGDLDGAERLLEMEPESLEVFGFGNMTPLLAAVRGGHEDIVRMLVSKGADIQAKVVFTDEQPLHLAAENGNVSMVNLLLDLGADPNVEDAIGRTPLWYALYKKHKPTAEILLARGADINHRTAEGKTMLEEAASFLDCASRYVTDSYIAENIIVMEALINLGADPGRMSSNDLLRVAARHGEIGVAQSLLKANADVNAAGPDGETPLHVAARQGQTSMVELLLAHGAKVDEREKSVGRAASRRRTPLHCAVEGIHAEVAGILLEHGANPNCKDRCGQTPLHYAADWGLLDIVKLLLHHGADIRVEDREGRTPVDLAKIQGFVRPLEEGDDGLRSKKFTRRHWNKKQKVAVLLEQHGAPAAKTRTRTVRKEVS